MAEGRLPEERTARLVHPYRKTATYQVVVGGVMVASGALLGLGSGVASAHPAVLVVSGAQVAIGALFVYFGTFSRRQVDGILLNNAAHDLVSRGRVAEAEALLGAVRGASGNLRRAVESQRAVIALRRGDGRAAEEHADAAIAAPRHLLTRHVDDGQIAAVVAIRAFARAIQGKEAEALEDVRVVRASDATPEALARAALAEAIVLARGERQELAACLRKATPLVEYLAPRERALLRALRRMVEVRVGAIYREPGQRTEPSGEEPLVGEWVSKIVPEAAAFVPEAARQAQIERLEVAPAQASGVVAGSVAIAGQAAAKATKTRGRRVLALWAVLVVMFLALWQFLSPADPGSASHRPHAAPPVETAADPFTGVTALAAIVIALTFAIAFARGALALRRSRALQSALRSATRKLAASDVAAGEAELRGLLERSDKSTAANASLLLAGLAERRCALGQAQKLCDEGLAGISRLPALRALHSDVLVPELIAERAFILAATGRADEANAELATLARDHATFAFMTRSVFRVRLVQALRRGDLEEAVRLSRERTPELPLSRRDELLADAVLAVSSGRPSANESAEVESIVRELAEDRELAAWIDFMAPGISGRLAAMRSVRSAGASSPQAEPALLDAEEAEAGRTRSV